MRRPTRQAAIALLARCTPEQLEAMATLVETSEIEGDYSGGDCDTGSIWQESGSSTLHAIANLIRSLKP